MVGTAIEMTALRFVGGGILMGANSFRDNGSSPTRTVRFLSPRSAVLNDVEPSV
jgi:hypothetical protein